MKPLFTYSIKRFSSPRERHEFSSCFALTIPSLYSLSILYGTAPRKGAPWSR